MDGDSRKPRLFLESRFSPPIRSSHPTGNGCVSNESGGTVKVYVQALPGPGEKIRSRRPEA